MPLIPYTKPSLTFSEQVNHLKSKGMLFKDKAFAESTLANISYYRLSAYWYPFRLRDTAFPQQVLDKFEAEIFFEDALFLYETDRRLRSLVIDAIERVEVSVRTQFTYHIGHKYGTFGYTDKNNFHNKFDHHKWLTQLQGEVQRSKDEFIDHYKNSYQNFPSIPIWMLTEVMSLGALSFGYGGLINDQKRGIEDKKSIAQHFNVHHKQLGDWLHTLTYVRNICAHHGRLWNRSLAIKPDLTKDIHWLPPLTPRNDRIFYILLMLRHLLRATGNGEDWTQQVNQALDLLAHNERWQSAMGMTDNWREHPIWK